MLRGLSADWHFFSAKTRVVFAQIDVNSSPIQRSLLFESIKHIHTHLRL